MKVSDCWKDSIHLYRYMQHNINLDLSCAFLSDSTVNSINNPTMDSFDVANSYLSGKPKKNLFSPEMSAAVSARMTPERRAMLVALARDPDPMPVVSQSDDRFGDEFGMADEPPQVAPVPEFPPQYADVVFDHAFFNEEVVRPWDAPPSYHSEGRGIEAQVVRIAEVEEETQEVAEQNMPEIMEWETVTDASDDEDYLSDFEQEHPGSALENRAYHYADREVESLHNTDDEAAGFDLEVETFFKVKDRYFGKADGPLVLRYLKELARRRTYEDMTYLPVEPGFIALRHCRFGTCVPEALAAIVGDFGRADYDIRGVWKDLMTEFIDANPENYRGVMRRQTRGTPLEVLQLVLLELRRVLDLEVTLISNKTARPGVVYTHDLVGGYALLISSGFRMEHVVPVYVHPRPPDTDLMDMFLAFQQWSGRDLNRVMPGFGSKFRQLQMYCMWGPTCISDSSDTAKINNKIVGLCVLRSFQAIVRPEHHQLLRDRFFYLICKGYVRFIGEGTYGLSFAGITRFHKYVESFGYEIPVVFTAFGVVCEVIDGQLYPVGENWFPIEPFVELATSHAMAFQPAIDVHPTVKTIRPHFRWTWFILKSMKDALVEGANEVWNTLVAQLDL
jgi:hypothetical protein